MPISQKCQYGLRAIYELAKHEGSRPLKIAEIARRQAIPLRFLEVILNGSKEAASSGRFEAKMVAVCWRARPAN